MFTNKERKLLKDPYFRVIREEEQFIEVQSLNTGHCWNIFKNQFEAKYKVILYHKHKLTDQYYHQHWKCRNVVEALSRIKSHDDYVIEKASLKKKQEEISSGQAARHIKVYETRGYRYKPTATILLKGEWLKSWGFEPGMPVEVVCDGAGKLIITATNVD